MYMHWACTHRPDRNKFHWQRLVLRDVPHCTRRDSSLLSKAHIKHTDQGLLFLLKCTYLLKEILTHILSLHIPHGSILNQVTYAIEARIQ